MSKTYNINKISKLFNIPKSTLRYWENEGLISSIRNKDNDYREYNTNSLIEICYIKFYRSLNFPIKKLKKIWQMNIADNEELLKQYHKEIELIIEEKYKTLGKIEKYLSHIELFKKLKENPYTIDNPPFNKIVYLHPGETENVLEYIDDQNILAFVANISSKAIHSFGTVSNDSTNNSQLLLWEDDSKPHEYITCLLRTKNDVIDKDYLDTHLKYIESISKHPGVILAKYLTSDSADDYFQCWIEIL